MFQGFTEETVAFLWGIRLNNEREWFLAHKQDYLNALYHPLQALGEEVQQQVMEQYPDLMLNMRVSRIYRDARRLHGRGPYKDHLWFVLRAPTEQWTASPAFYFEISPEGYEYGMGYYCAKPSMMEQYRKRVLREPQPLVKLANKLNTQQRFKLEGEEYKRSKGETVPELAGWFNRKSIALTAFRAHDALETTSELVKEITDGFCWLMPYYDYFKQLECETNQ